MHPQNAQLSASPLPSAEAASRLAIRPVVDADGHALVALVTACWAVYPGCIMDVDSEETGLKAPASRYGDTFWVARQALGSGRLVGSIGYQQSAEAAHDEVELIKLYVAPDLQRQGLASQLFNHLTGQLPPNRRCIRLWTDTRFQSAHAFYEAQGFVRTGRTRMLHDLSATKEYEYIRKQAA